MDPLNVEVRFAANRAFVADLDHVNVFELEHGTRVARFTPAPHTCIGAKHDADVLVSPDGKRFVACQMLVSSPFSSGVSTWFTDFSATSATMFAANRAGDGFDFLDLTSQKRTEWKLPYIADHGFLLAVAHDGQRMLQIDERAALVASPGATAWTVVARFDAKWKSAAIALSGSAALGLTEAATVYLDLRTGVQRPIGSYTPGSAISPNGQRVALSESDRIRIVRASGEEVASIAAPHTMHVTFADDNTIAYVADHELHVHNIAAGPLRFDEPSRFVGWSSDADATVARGSAIQRLDVRTLATTPSSAPTPTEKTSDLAITQLPVWRASDLTNDGGCQATLRVHSSAKETSFTMKNEDCTQQVGTPWVVVKDRVVRVTESAIDVFDAASTKTLAHLDVTSSNTRDPQLRSRFWNATLAPDGTHLAVWWRRARIPAQRVRTAEGELPPECDFEAASFFESCDSEYFLELWSLAAKPTRTWFSAATKKATTPAVFTPDGKHLLVGLDDGSIEVRSAATGELDHTETLHRVPIARIEVSPGQSYVFSEDAEGEQRIWPLTHH